MAFLSVAAHSMLGQVLTSLYFMDNLPQSSVLNPAFTPNYDFYFGLPIINNVNASFVSDIALDDIYSDGDFFWNSEAGYNAFVNGLKPRSYVLTEMNTSILNFGFAQGSSAYFHFAVTSRVDVITGIPQDLFRMNDLSIGHDLSPIEVESKWFNEYALAYSYAITDKLVLGAKVKFLAGVAASNIVFDEFELATGEEQWRVDVDGHANMSAAVELTNNDDGYPIDAEMMLDMEVADILDYVFTGYENPGFGFDLGAEYEIIPGLKLSASVLDLGKIFWKRDLVNYEMQGDYTFDGLQDIVVVEGDDIINIDETVAENLVDTIQNQIPLGETSESFSTSLSPKVYVGAEYEFTESLSLGLLYKARFIRQDLRQNIYFNANVNLKNILTLGANYNVGVNTQNSFGGVIGLRLSPFYLYFAADMIPGYADGGTTISDQDGDILDLPITLPADFSAASFQVGINIALGDRRKVARRNAKWSGPSLLGNDTDRSSTNHPF